MSQLDLVFICDSTGSMGSYIEAAKRNIQTIIQKIIQFERADVRFALVEYKDHPPQGNTFNVKVTEFTQSRNEMQQAVDSMQATGGGDTPESICCAFHAAVNLGWREDSTKVIIWIADAPPHGFMRSGDGFPNGCPCGKDMIQEVRNCIAKDIVIYSVGTEPLYVEYLRTFMRAVSQLSNGQYVALSSAELLSDMIINGCREEIQLKKIIMDVRKRLEAMEDFTTLTDEEKQKRIDTEVDMLTKDLQVDTVVVDNIFEEELPPVPELFLTCQSLRELKARMYETPDIQLHMKPTAQHNYGEQIATARMYSAFGTPLMDDGSVTKIWGAAPTGFGSATTGFGSAPGFGAAPTGWGAATGFGAATTGFGAAPTGFGSATTGFGSTTGVFGSTTGGFGAATGVFGSTTGVFGAPPMQSVSSVRQDISLGQQARMKSRVYNAYSNTSIPSYPQAPK